MRADAPQAVGENRLQRDADRACTPVVESDYTPSAEKRGTLTMKSVALFWALGTLLFVTSCGSSTEDEQDAAPTAVSEARPASLGATLEAGAPASVLFESPDSSVTLRGSPSSLPADLAPDDIEITRVDETEVRAEGGGALVFAYSLEPEGTEFSEPVALTVRARWESDQSFTFVHLSDTVEPISPSDLVFDPETGLTAFTFELRSFSTIAAFTESLVEASFEEMPTDAQVGRSFTVTLNAQPVEHPAQSVYSRGPPYRRATTRAENLPTDPKPWRLKVRWNVYGPASPSTQKLRSTATIVNYRASPAACQSSSRATRPE